MTPDTPRFEYKVILMRAKAKPEQNQFDETFSQVAADGWQYVDRIPCDGGEYQQLVFERPADQNGE